MDKDLLVHLEKQSEKKINYTYNQLKWWEEYHNIKMEKIKNHYIDCIETDL